MNISKIFLMTLDVLKNAKWKLGQNRQVFKLGNQKNYFSIIGIVVQEREGKIFFLINESTVELEMIKN